MQFKIPKFGFKSKKRGNAAGFFGAKLSFISNHLSIISNKLSQNNHLSIINDKLSKKRINYKLSIFGKKLIINYKLLIAVGVLALAATGGTLALNGFFGGGGAIPEDTMTRGLVGYWSFDEGGGTIARDASGNNNHGTLTNGPQWTQGKSGGALQFDGKDDYVDAGNGSSLNITDSITLEAWVFMDYTGSKNSDLGFIAKESSYLLYDTWGELRVMSAFWIDGAWRHSTSTGVNSNQWYHLVTTYSSLDRTIRFYIDGNEVAPVVLSGLSAYSLNISANNVHLGNGTLGKKNRVDEARIYNRVLTAEEVRYHYNHGGPVAYWDMDEGSGLKINDKSGNGNDGTISGAAWTQGKYGSALSFDGAGDYVSTNSSDSLNLSTNNFSIGAWVKHPPSDAAVSERIVHKFDETQGYYLVWKPSTKRFEISVSGYFLGPYFQLDDNNWHYVSAVFNRSSICGFYVDGKLIGSVNISSKQGSSVSNNSNLYIGNNNWYGQIDEVKIYDYARTEEEIRLDYNAGLATHLGPSGKTCSEDPAGCMDFGLAGHWDMDEGGGSMINDKSGNNNHGTLANDPKWTKGKNGTALQFDGKDDYVDCGSDASLNIYDALSIEAWVRPDANKRADVVSRYYYSGATNNGGYSLRFWDDGKFYLVTLNDSQAGISANGVVGKWNHVIATYDVNGGANNLKIYINGTLAGQTTKANALKSITQNFKIGGFSYYHDGLVDGVKIYNRALSAEEVRYHYNQGKPVGYWAMDEGSGAAIKDQSGNGNDGTISGATWTQGKHGTALSFDGVDDSVNCGNDTSLNITKEITLGLWIKRADVSEKINQGIIQKENTGGYVLSLNYGTADHKISFISPLVGTRKMATSIDDTEWHHIVCAVDENSSSLKFYIDGQLDSTHASVGTLAANASSLLIGRRTDYFAGQIDEVKIYDYARTEEEIRLDYNAGLATHLGPSGKTCSEDPAGCMDFGLAGHWDMDEGSGSLINDKSGNNNHGTLTNGPQWTKGKSGTALQFDGKNDYVDAGNNLTLQPASTVTLEYWMYPRKFSNGTNERSVVGWRNIGKGIYTNLWNSYLYAQFWDGSAWQGIFFTLPSLNQWYHIVITYDASGGSNNYKIYSNGILKNQTTKIGNIVYTGGYFSIGNNTTIPFDGILDGIRLYNRALSAEEVRYHYNQGRPVAQWDMDEGEGTRAFDVSGNNNTGVLTNGPTWVEGKRGSALSFDGVDDYVNSGSKSNLNITGDITIGAWIKPSGLTGNGAGHHILNKMSSWRVDGYDFRIGTGTQDKLQFITGARGNDVVSETILQNDTWYYVVAVQKGTEYKKLYINGVNDGIKSNPSALISSGTANLKIGTYLAGGEYFNGEIDEVKVYNYARTAEQIMQDYNAGVAAHLK